MQLNKIAKIAKRGAHDILFTNDKVVATDGFSLIEANYPAEGLSTVIRPHYFKAGDKAEQFNGHPAIIRKDGAVIQPETSSADTYPDYQSIMPAEDAEGATLDVDRERLIQLLEAMPDDGEKNNKITLKIRTDFKDRALKITNKEATGLLMPLKS